MAGQVTGSCNSRLKQEKYILTIYQVMNVKYVCDNFNDGGRFKVERTVICCLNLSLKRFHIK